MIKKDELKTISFSVYSEYAKNGICDALNRIYNAKSEPVIVCVGSDLVLGDSLGPLVGTMIKSKNSELFVYGTLNSPVTAKEVSKASDYLKKMHNDLIVISIDAAVGEKEDVGTIKVLNRGIMPGLGVNKQLPLLGDISIIGIVAEKTDKNYNLFNLTRLGFVYKMAQTISAGLLQFTSKFSTENRLNKVQNKFII